MDDIPITFEHKLRGVKIGPGHDKIKTGSSERGVILALQIITMKYILYAYWTTKTDST